MYDIEHYVKAHSVAEAMRRLAENPAARLIAGGTDVLIKLRHLHADYRSLVDIHGLPELAGIERLGDGTLRIGSGTTFTQIIESPLVQRHIPVLAEAASTIAGPQIRNVATLGGNLCNGVTSADSATAALVLGAQLEIASPGGTRLTPLEGFHTGPGQVALARGEILLALHFPAAGHRDTGGSYYKYAMRAAMDIATIGGAALCRIEDGRFAMLRLAYGVAAPTPIRARTAEAAAVGQPVNDQTLAAIRAGALHDVSPRTSWRASREFRLQIIGTLAERLVAQAVHNARKERS